MHGAGTGMAYQAKSAFNAQRVLQQMGGGSRPLMLPAAAEVVWTHVEVCRIQCSTLLTPHDHGYPKLFLASKPIISLDIQMHGT